MYVEIPKVLTEDSVIREFGALDTAEAESAKITGDRNARER